MEENLEEEANITSKTYRGPWEGYRIDLETSNPAQFY